MEPVKVSLEKHPISQNLIREIITLSESVFESFDPQELKQRITTKTQVTVVVARADGKLIGFKLGYQKDIDTYYSWLGGVEKSRRGQGIGRKLMQAQHLWCQQQGYQFVETKTLNSWKQMLLLNLSEGFEIVDLEPDPKRSGKKILLQKKL